ncbi:MAG TPA: Rv3235 family protein [Pseudonocardia sp.]
MPRPPAGAGPDGTMPPRAEVGPPQAETGPPHVKTAPPLAEAGWPAGPTPTEESGLRGRAEVVLRLTLEAVAGRRPSAQLKGLVSREVLGYIAASANRPLTGRHRTRTSAGRTPRSNRTEFQRLGGAAPRVLRICQPTATAAEISAVWRHNGRFRALAARFELRDRGSAEPKWLCTFLRLG